MRVHRGDGPPTRTRGVALIAALVGAAALVRASLPLLAQETDQKPAVEVDALHRPLDQILDLYVRDGLVYYRALQLERRRLDQYVASLDVAPTSYEIWSRERRIAFWLNAYNAFVLRTVIDNYPIRGKFSEYPPNSVRQISGAFERMPHKAAGRTVTLDAIEKTILVEFRDPRLYFALGRGAVGSGRLRSEAFAAGALETQLSRVAAEVATTLEFVRIDQVDNRVTVSPIVGWHESEFIAAYDSPGSRHSNRSPIERAILAFVEPHLVPNERDFLEQNQFRVQYLELDWRLNDLTGR